MFPRAVGPTRRLRPSSTGWRTRFCPRGNAEQRTFAHPSAKALARPPIQTIGIKSDRAHLARKELGPIRNATHPINAILNYAYAVLESQVRTQIVADGYDPTIGCLHTY
jgi:CRISPR associated protein, Cas1 family